MTSQQAYLYCADCGAVVLAGGDGEEDVCPRGCCPSRLAALSRARTGPPGAARGERYSARFLPITYAGVVGAWVLLSGVLQAEAAGLGIPLDGFIGTFETFVTGLGLVVGLVGLTGYVGSLMDNPFSNILAGSVGFFVKAGLLGGGGALLGLMGLVGGATL